MIRENQKLLNRLNVLSDGLILYFALPLAFWIRFYLLPGGVISVPLTDYILINIFLMAAHLLCYTALGLYASHRRKKLAKELQQLWLTHLLIMAVLLSFLFITHEMYFSRTVLAIYVILGAGLLSAKRVALRLILRHLRAKGYNQKQVVLLGGGRVAQQYLSEIQRQPQLGYQIVGYVANDPSSTLESLPYLGDFAQLLDILEDAQPDEVVSAVDMSDYPRTPDIIDACEKAGVKLAIVPIYAEYMPAQPQFDAIGSLPLLNIRRIPLDNLALAACKRLIDIVFSLLLLVLLSPVMLLCAIGVKLSSPGPVIFKQQRVGRNKKLFYMYKFRSMRENADQDTAWSTNEDPRKTKFGAILRKYSLDELPQFFNVLKGDMSLVGPRPELPHFVDQFKEEVPLYMVKHQVRPGITGWAQVNDFRGDTSIKGRIEHDIFYIEHWTLLFDLRILLKTVFQGKFKNSEEL